MTRGNPVEFAGGTNHCSADGLHIYNILNPPSEAGFSFYGGVYSCALRNSIVHSNTYGVQVLNDRDQGAASYNLLVDNVEVYGNADHGFHVATHSGLTAYNHDIVFQRSRVHGNVNGAYEIEDGHGYNITFSDLDYTGDSTTPRSQITGYIDPWVATGSGKYDLRGWSCTTYDPDPVYVALYVGSTGVGWFRANQSSEPAVGTSMCAAGGVAHRYVIHFSAGQIQQWQGQVVSVFGISPWGFANNALGSNGQVTVPAPY